MVSMRAKLINEERKDGLHPSMPSLDELVDIFDDEVNGVVDLVINDDGSIDYYTDQGSSLKSEIRELFKDRGWDKFYNIKKIEFESGNYHEYIIYPQSESERITPTFDPESDLPEEEAEEAREAEEFVENFVDEAVYNAEDWIRMDQEEWEEMDNEDKRAFVSENIDDFFEHYSGAFIDHAFYANHDHIISSIASRLG